MAGDTIEVQGIKKLRKELKALDTELGNKAQTGALKRVMLETAEIVAAESRSLAPKLTGALADSVRAQGRATTGVVKAGRGARLPYAAAIHFGWAKHGIRANPFVYEAIDHRRDEVINRVDRAISNLVEQTFTAGTGV
jgi:HK97 gp10 family phage protein